MSSNENVLMIGKEYENISGGKYLCAYVFRNGSAELINIVSGWTLKAHGIYFHDNGKIEWNYSTEGHFKEG